MSVRTVIERGPKEKQSVAFAIDWPGWSRGAKSPELALETLESYRERYRHHATVASSTVFGIVMHTMTNPLATFDTALGRCAMRWSDRGITRVILPSRGPMPAPVDLTAGHLPPFVRAAIEGITALMAGGSADLRDLPLDERDLDEFCRAVYTATREIEPGTTRSYGQVAQAIGRPDAARDVGVALARNPVPIIVPCHRVVAANGALTGFSAPGGLATKRRMLELEGAPGYGQQLLFG